jgi:hypothetical protein
MSATGRNLEGNERHENDFYETPVWCIEAILPNLRGPKSVLDAGAGSGVIIKRCKSRWSRSICVGVDIIPQDRIVKRVNFFNVVTNYDLVIANPPYTQALEFVEHAFKIGKEIAFLLRLNWLGAQERAGFHRRHPADIFVLPRRPSFTGGGGTDATEYAWFVWGPGRGNRWWMLNIYAVGQ